MGNLRSVQKAFERLGTEAKISNDPLELAKSDKIVLPGVGYFSHGMGKLINIGFVDALKEAVMIKKKPILGICLGMQLLTEHSDEGDADGLGFIEGSTKKFQESNLKIPHMGWNSLKIKSNNSILNDIDENALFYFVHSYYVTCKNENDILSFTTYGTRFVSSFQKGNIFGCQFHPEKSHDTGLKLLKNFADI